MQVSSTHNLIFKNDETGEAFNLKKTGHNEFVQVPDWLEDNDYFNLCTSDGRVRVVEVKTVPTVKPPSDEPTGIDLSAAYVSGGLAAEAPKRVRVKKAN